MLQLRFETARIMDTEMAEKIRATVVLGDEFDDSLRHMIFNVLSEMGALFVDYGGRAVAGSQEVEALRVLIDGQELNVEAETYAGLSISGPAELVLRVQRAMTSKQAG